MVPPSMRQASAQRTGIERPADGTRIPAKRTGFFLHRLGRHPQKRHAQTDRFFVPAVNWLRADEKGNFKPYPNHWHFTATSEKQKVYRFATIVYTHAKADNTESAQTAPQKLKDGSIQVGDWNIRANISTAGKPSFEVKNTRKGYNASVSYKDYGATVIHDNGKKTTLKDEIPELEI